MKHLLPTTKAIRAIVLAGLLLSGVSLASARANAAVCVCNYRLCLCATVGPYCYCVPVL
jgi:hypothetical protein